MMHRFGWKLVALGLLCVFTLSGTAGARPRKMSKAQKASLLRRAYYRGWVFVCLTPEGVLKRVVSKNAELTKQAQQEAMELYQEKQLAYTQARSKFLEKKPGQKYARLKPFKPDFITVTAAYVSHSRGYKLEPRDHYYGLYKVVANGKLMYEVGYAFSDATQQLKYRVRYISKYNLWVRKPKSEKPVEPVFEKLAGRMTEPNAQRAAQVMAAWQKQHDLWVKRGSKPETEPEKPGLSVYQEKLNYVERRLAYERKKAKAGSAKKATETSKPVKKAEKKAEPKEKKTPTKTKKDAGWS